MMEGVCVGSSLAGRPPRPRQPLLDLRQQSHHHRRQYAHHLHGGRRGALPWLRMERSAGRRCQRYRTASSTPSTIFRETKGRPTFIILDSHIGYGSPHKQDTAEAHGEPLGEEEVRLTKRSLWLARGREVPRARRRLRAFRAGIGARGATARREWTEALRRLQAKHIPNLAAEIDQMQRRELPAGWDRNLPFFRPIRRASRDETLPAKC